MPSNNKLTTATSIQPSRKPQSRKRPTCCFRHKTNLKYQLLLAMVAFSGHLAQAAISSNPTANPTTLLTSDQSNGTLLAEHAAVTNNHTKAHVSSRVLQDDDFGSSATASWTKSSKDLIYDGGFALRFLVVVLMMIVVALALMYLHRLRHRNLTKAYNAVPNLYPHHEKTSLSVNIPTTVIYEDDDDDEINVFDASQHKLLAKERSLRR